MSYEFEEMAPPATLSRWVAAFWQLRLSEGASPAAHRVLPDGCVDILFDFVEWAACARSGAAAPAGRLVGQMTRAIVVPLPAQADVFGIRFRPGVIGSLATCPGRDVQDIAISLADGGIHLAVSDEHLFREASLANRVHRVLPALERHLGARPQTDRTIVAAIAAWENAVDAFEPLPSVAAVAARVGTTERSLERRFNEWAGYRPAQFRRLVRFRSALRASDSGRRSWADVAARCGYADQSHLSRDFSEFAATTATVWAEEQRPTGGEAQRSVGFLQDAGAAPS